MAKYYTDDGPLKSNIIPESVHDLPKNDPYNTIVVLRQEIKDLKSKLGIADEYLDAVRADVQHIVDYGSGILKGIDYHRRNK